MRAIASCLVLLLAVACAAVAEPIDPGNAFVFAVTGAAIGDTERSLGLVLRAADEGAAAFVVHFDGSAPSRASCGDDHLRGLREVLDASARPVVPVVAASQWASCGDLVVDANERLARVDDALFGSDQSLGQAPMHWLRQSAVPRFRRYRENLRWQVGDVLFVALNLPDNNNNFRLGAGRNGEFDDRVVANREWMVRAFRFAEERRLAGIVVFVDAAPRFGLPMRPPDSRARERDGYYEWKAALRDATAAFKGQVLLVQGHVAAPAERPSDLDHPLRDAGGRPLANLTRVALPEAAGAAKWLRVEVDPHGRQLFRVRVERVFDDPSGELYGPGRTP